jgi:transcriptional regulator with XRE-family HTH domain
MNKPEAYERPNGPEISRRRKIQGWSPQFLAKKARVGVSTLKRAERGEPIQLQNLSKIARAIGVEIEVLYRPVAKPSSSLQILERWGAEYDMIAQAETSVLILDSYFSEYGRLGSALRARSRKHPKPLDIEIYMASPDYDFGAQRFREMTAVRALAPAKKPQRLLRDQLTDKEREDYEHHFHFLEQSIAAAVRPFAPEFKIYEYSCMPGLRVVVIDEMKYVFGWYPLGAQNPAHTCFHLKFENLGGADASLLYDLQDQINNVKAASIPSVRKSRRPRNNRRKKSGRLSR